MSDLGSDASTSLLSSTMQVAPLHDRKPSEGWMGTAAQEFQRIARQAQEERAKLSAPRRHWMHSIRKVVTKLFIQEVVNRFSSLVSSKDGDNEDEAAAAEEEARLRARKQRIGRKISLFVLCTAPNGTIVPSGEDEEGEIFTIVAYVVDCPEPPAAEMLPLPFHGFELKKPPAALMKGKSIREKGLSVDDKKPSFRELRKSKSRSIFDVFQGPASPGSCPPPSVVPVALDLVPENAHTPSSSRSVVRFNITGDSGSCTGRSSTYGSDGHGHSHRNIRNLLSDDVTVVDGGEHHHNGSGFHPSSPTRSPSCRSSNSRVNHSRAGERPKTQGKESVHTF
jgi:hypothetical protein